MSFRWRLIIVLLILVHWFKAAAMITVTIDAEVNISNRTQVSMFDIIQTKGLSLNSLLKMRDIQVYDENVSSNLTLDGKSLISILRNFIKQIDLKSENNVENPNNITKTVNAEETEPRFKIVVPDYVKLKRNNESKAEFERKFKNILAANCSDCDFELSYSQNNLDAWPVNWETDWLKLSEKKTSYLLPLFERNENNIMGAKPKWMTIQVKSYQLAYLANRTLQAMEKISLNDFRKEKTEVNFTKDRVAKAEDLLKFNFLQNMVPKNKILYVADLRPEIVVQRGQVVRLIVATDSFSVEGQAIAEQAGSVGEVIKVRNTSNNKVTSALIVEKGTTRLE